MVFFTVALADRKSRLLVEEVEALRKAVQAAKAERPFCIDAWVVLLDHLHCIWTLPGGDAEYSVRWKEIKTCFTKSLGWIAPRSASKIAKGEAGIWHLRFWDHHIRDDCDFTTHLRYCWWNPVKHRLVEKPIEWPYSSIHRDIRLGQVEPEWAGVEITSEFGELGWCEPIMRGVGCVTLSKNFTPLHRIATKMVGWHPPYARSSFDIVTIPVEAS